MAQKSHSDSDKFAVIYFRAVSIIEDGEMFQVSLFLQYLLPFFHLKSSFLIKNVNNFMFFILHTGFQIFLFVYSFSSLFFIYFFCLCNTYRQNLIFPTPNTSTFEDNTMMNRDAYAQGVAEEDVYGAANYRVMFVFYVLCTLKYR